MSDLHRSHFPPEILDYIVDHLHDKRDALKNCCLVSKSWVPRSRKHLFGYVKIHSAAKLNLWKKMFPDKSDSPACHTHTISLTCPEEVTAADAEEGGWIRSFSHVVRLGIHSDPMKYGGPVVPLTPFHGFSPALNYLRILSSTLPNSQIFDLICSLPLLEDLTLGIGGTDDNVPSPDVPLRVVQPTSPALTGTLDLTVFGGMESIARRFLGLPNGLHFRELVLSWFYKEDLQWIIALVVGCSDTLERLSVTCHLRSAFVSFLRSTCSSPSPAGNASIDLSKATKLKSVIFLPVTLSVEWITLALQTIAPKHRDLQRICIHLPYHQAFTGGANIRQTIGEATCGQWLAFDHALVQLWESFSIRPKITYIGPVKEKEVSESMDYLLPKAMKRGIINLVEWRVYQ